MATDMATSASDHPELSHLKWHTPLASMRVGLRIPPDGISQTLVISDGLVGFVLVRCGRSGGVKRVVGVACSGRLAAAGFVATAVTSSSRLMGYCPV